MRDYLSLGPVPCDEDCQQIGSDTYDYARDTADLYRYKAMLQERWPTAHFGVKSFSHDFGTYREIVVYFDDEDEDAVAYDVEANLPQTWNDWPF